MASPPHPPDYQKYTVVCEFPDMPWLSPSGPGVGGHPILALRSAPMKDLIVGSWFAAGAIPSAIVTGIVRKRRQ